MTSHVPKRLVFLLAAIFAMTPYAIDSYLPAIPMIATDFNVETAMISITVSLYVFGMAIGQLIGGPLSDRYGRRPIIVLGLLVFAICSYFLAAVQTVEYFWLWRFIQSVSGGIAVVGVPATIRDVAKGKEAAKLFSLVAMIMMIAPSIAPSIGTLIMNLWGWQWIFNSSGILAFLVAIWALYVMPKPQITPLKPGESIGFLSVLSNRHAQFFLITQAFCYAVLMTFLTNAPFAYIVHYKATPELLSLLLVINIVGVVMVSRLNAWLLNRHSPESLLVKFITAQLLGCGVLVVSQIIAPDSLWFAAAGFFAVNASIGGILSNSTACYLRHFGKNAGAASALLGAVQFFIGAVISALAALLTQQSLWPMILIMLISIVLSLAGAKLGSQFMAKEAE